MSQGNQSLHGAEKPFTVILVVYFHDGIIFNVKIVQKNLRFGSVVVSSGCSFETLIMAEVKTHWYCMWKLCHYYFIVTSCSTAYFVMV